MNSFGRIFRVTILGESHGNCVGVVLDGVPAGIELTEESFESDLNRRRTGAVGTTDRKESDKPHIVSGLYHGHTTGSPLTILFQNSNIEEGDYIRFVDHPRPSHVDWVAGVKYGGYADLRGGGHFSGRLTLPLVAAGVVAKKILEGCIFTSHISSVGGQSHRDMFDRVISDALNTGDSVGGVVETVVTDVPSGLGEPFFDSAESLVAHILFSIPGVKGVEFGAGFAAAAMRGSHHNDPLVAGNGTTDTNHAGGAVGGITNGNPLVVRAALKPAASISAPQMTFNMKSKKMEELKIGGRHDTCIALRAAVVVEAAIAIALADMKLVML